MTEAALGYEQLVKTGTFEKFASDVDMLREHFVQLENGIKLAVAPLAKKMDGGITNVADLQKQSAAIDKTNAAYEAQINILREKQKIDQEQIVFKDNLKKANAAEAAATKKLADETKKANAQTRDQIQLQKLNEKAAKSAAGSYNELSAKLGIVSIRAKQMSAAHRENTATGKLVIAQQLELRNKLIALDETTNLHVRKVGNYTGAVTKLARGLGGLTGLMGTLGNVLGLDTTLFQGLTDVGHELIKTSKELHHTTELNEVAEVAHGEAVVESTAAEELHNTAMAESAVATETTTVATDALTPSLEAATVATTELNTEMELNPILIIVAAIVALGAALYGLNAYMTGSSDETKKLTIENAKLNKEYEESKLILDRKIEVAESELELMKAQGVPLETIRKKEHEINAEKEKALLNNIATIKSNIQLDVSKLNDIKSNDSIFESLLRVAEQTEKNLGLTDAAAATEKLIQINKAERAKDTIDDANKQLDALAKAQADWNTLKADELKQDEDITKTEVSNSEKRKKKLEDEAKAEQELMDLEAQRLVTEMERQNELDGELLDDKGQKIAKLKDQRDKDATDRQQELDDQLITQQQYDDDILALDTKLAADIADLNKKETDAVAAAQVEQTKSIMDALQKQEDAWQDAIDARNKRYEDELTQIDDLTKAFGKGMQDRVKAQQDALQQQTSLIDSEVQTQTALFTAGFDNNLDAEKKARADATEQGLKLARKAAKEQKAMQLAESYISFVQSYLKAGQDAKSATVKAFAETAIVEGVSDAISGKYKDGVENLDGAGNETSDSNLALLSKGESVLTAKGTRETAGLATSINEDGYAGAVDWAMRNIYAPNFAASMVASDAVGGNANTDYSLMLELNTRLEKSIERGFSKVNVTNWSQNAIGKLVKEESSNGQKLTTIHHGRVC